MITFTFTPLRAASVKAFLTKKLGKKLGCENITPFFVQQRIEGTLSYIQNQNKIELPVSIKTRGKSRFAFCKYKPMDIKFSKTQKVAYN